MSFSAINIIHVENIHSKLYIIVHSKLIAQILIVLKSLKREEYRFYTALEFYITIYHYTKTEL